MMGRDEVARRLVQRVVVWRAGGVEERYGSEDGSS